MTQRYIKIRNEIYRGKPTNALKYYRSLSDMLKIFNKGKWILIIVYGVYIIGLIISVFVNHISLIIFAFFLLLISYFEANTKEKFFYDQNERNKEIIKIDKNYEDYIKAIHSVLIKNGITNIEKFNLLYEECSNTLDNSEKRISSAHSRIIDMFIGVPIGAFITKIIENETFNPNHLLLFIIIFPVVFSICKAIKVISNLTEGKFQDNYLYSILKEFSYHKDLLYSPT